MFGVSCELEWFGTVEALYHTIYLKLCGLSSSTGLQFSSSKCASQVQRIEKNMVMSLILDIIDKDR